MGKSYDVAEGVAHQTAAQRIPKVQTFGSVKAEHPGNRAGDVTNRRNRDDQKKAGAQLLDTVEDLTQTGFLHEIAEQNKTEQ